MDKTAGQQRLDVKTKARIKNSRKKLRAIKWIFTICVIAGVLEVFLFHTAPTDLSHMANEKMIDESFKQGRNRIVMPTIPDK